MTVKRRIVRSLGTSVSLLAAMTTAIDGRATPATGPLSRPDRGVLKHGEHAYATALPAQVVNELRAARADYGYDVRHVDLDLTVNFTLPEIVAISTLDIDIEQAGLTSLVFDLNNTLVVTSALVDGAPRTWTQAVDTMTIDLPSAPDVGSTLAVAIGYHGRPLEIGNKSMRFRTHLGTPVVYTLSTPFSNITNTVIPISHYWRPCNDDPTDKSTYSCALTVPSTMTACSNGAMTAEVDNLDGTKTFHWEHGFPIAPYLITLGATNYARLTDTYVGTTHTLDIRNFAWPEDLAAATSDWSVIPGQLGVFESLYGEYPFAGEKFGLYQIAPGPAVEHQTMISYPDNIVDGTGQWDWLIAHEMAHMWWGDLVTVSDWAHVWLSEGFASYSEALYRESSGGSAALEAYMLVLDEGPYDGTVLDPPYVWHDIVYDQGAWILHMLRHFMDDPTFFDMLRDYRDAHAYGNVTTPDFIAAAESAYGGDLDWFFTPWLTGNGRPEYEYSWEGATLPGTTLELDLSQVQSLTQPTYAMFVDVEVTTTAGTELHRIFNDQRDQSYSIPLAAGPTAVRLDPHHWVMANFSEVPVSVESPAVSPAASLAQNRPNPVRGDTEIAYELGRTGVIALRVFDAQGRLVRTLERGVRQAGPHRIRWDGTNERGEEVSAGVYFYRLVGPHGQTERTLVVQR
jgi:aminopeptidase N